MLFTQTISEKMLTKYSIDRRAVIDELTKAKRLLETTYRDIPIINRKKIAIRFFELHDDTGRGLGFHFDDTAYLEQNYTDLSYPGAEFYTIATLQRI